MFAKLQAQTEKCQLCHELVLIGAIININIFSITILSWL